MPATGDSSTQDRKRKNISIAKNIRFCV